MKAVLSLVALLLVALPLPTASALSVFVHNSNTPPNAQVTYEVRDSTARYYYLFHRSLTGDGQIELPLPVQFEQGDTVTIAVNMTSPYVVAYGSDPGTLGDLGIDVYYNLENTS